MVVTRASQLHGELRHVQIRIARVAGLLQLIQMNRIVRSTRRRRIWIVELRAALHTSVLGVSGPRDRPASVSGARSDVTGAGRRHCHSLSALVADDAGVVISGEHILRSAVAILDFVGVLRMTLNLRFVMAARGCVVAS